MRSKVFERYIDEIRRIVKETTETKNDDYAGHDDRLINFRYGAEMQGETMPQTWLGYVTKHDAALRKMIDDDNFDRYEFVEKIKDSIAYREILYAIVMGEYLDEEM